MLYTWAAQFQTNEDVLRFIGRMAFKFGGFVDWYTI